MIEGKKTLLFDSVDPQFNGRFKCVDNSPGPPWTWVPQIEVFDTWISGLMWQKTITSLSFFLSLIYKLFTPNPVFQEPLENFLKLSHRKGREPTLTCVCEFVCLCGNTHVHNRRRLEVDDGRHTGRRHRRRTLPHLPQRYTYGFRFSRLGHWGGGRVWREEEGWRGEGREGGPESCLYHRLNNGCVLPVPGRLKTRKESYPVNRYWTNKRRDKKPSHLPFTPPLTLVCHWRLIFFKNTKRPQDLSRLLTDLSRYHPYETTSWTPSGIWRPVCLT